MTASTANPPAGSSARVRPRHVGHTRRWAISRLFGYIVLIGLSLISVFPLVWMILTSLKTRDTVFVGPLIPDRVSFDAYAFIWNEMGIGRPFMNNVLLTLAATLGVVFFATLGGYAFSVLPIPGKDVIFGILMAALLIPGALIIVPAFAELRGMGLLNSLTGLALIHIGMNIPFAVFLMRMFFDAIPKELREAAIVDGASEFTVFTRVALPLCLPGTATVGIFQVMFTWNDLMLSNGLIQSQANRTLQPALYALVGQYSTNWPALTAALTTAAVPIIIFFVLMQKPFVAGLIAGSVKG